MPESILNDSGFAASAAVEPKIEGNGHKPVLTSDDPVTSQSDFQANLQTVGFTQLIQQTETRINYFRIERTTTQTQRKAILAEFHALGEIQDVPDRTLPGFESMTRPYEMQLAVAKRYRGFSVVSALAAIVFGIYFSVNSLVSSSVPLLVAGCLVITVALGWLATGLLTVFTHAHPRNPAAERTLNKVVYVSGSLLVAGLVVFGTLRFLSEMDSSVLLPLLIVDIELMLIVCAGAFESCRNLFVWSGELDQRFHELGKREAELNGKLESEIRILDQLKERLTRVTYNVNTAKEGK